MNLEEIQEEVNNRIEGLIGSIVQKRLDKIIVPESTELANMVFESRAFKDFLYNYFEQKIANEVGNRLRCGIYDGTAVDKLFDSIWTEQLDRAIEDRIRGRIYKTIDSIIAEKLKSLKT